MKRNKQPKYKLGDKLWLIRPDVYNTHWEVLGKVGPITRILIDEDSIFYYPTDLSGNGGCEENRFFKYKKQAIIECKKRTAIGLKLEKQIEKLRTKEKTLTRKEKNKLEKLVENFWSVTGII
jgi:hypothetical protein